jgi:DNA-binding GntR family transcriptional regulator
MPRPSSVLPVELAARILDRALSERWPVGRALRQEALAKLFDVSRSPVRAALLLLHEQGAVAWQPNAGFFLAHASAELVDFATRAREVTP